MTSNSNQVWFECVFLVEEHAVLEGILSGRPGSPQSCTGAGLPLGGDGWVTLPSHGRGAPGCRAASGWKWTQSTVWSGVSIVYDPGLWRWAPGPTASHLNQKDLEGFFAARLQFKDQRKGLKLLMIPEKYALKKKKRFISSWFFFFFQQFSWWQPFDALRANFLNAS